MLQAGRLLIFCQLLWFCAGCRHHLVWGSSGGFHHWLNALQTVLLLAACATGGLAFVQALRLAAAGPLAPASLRRPTFLAMAIAVLAPPSLSMDAFDYLLRGRVLAVHGGNPYVQVAADFPSDPLLAFGDAGWQAYALPYGPLVADLQAAIAWLGHWPALPPVLQVILGLLVWKLVMAAALLGAAGMARGVAERLQPGTGDRGFLLIAWNPLLLNEGIVQAHNDVLLVLALVATVWLAGRGSWAMAATALGLGALAKIVPLVAAPLLCVAAAKQRRLWSLLLGSLLPLACLAQAALRYFTAEGALGFLGRQSGILGASFGWLAVGLGVPLAVYLWAGRSLVVLAVLAAANRLWRSADPRALAASMAAVLLVMALVGVALFSPWYHLWWSPLALLAARGWLQRAAFLATLLAPLGYVVWTADRSLASLHQGTTLALALVLPLMGAWCWRGELPGVGLIRQCGNRQTLANAESGSSGSCVED
jgi:hypothetical protein